MNDISVHDEWTESQKWTVDWTVYVDRLLSHTNRDKIIDLTDLNQWSQI